MKKMLYLVLAAVLMFTTFLQFTPTYAAGLTSVKDTMSRLKASTVSDHTIQYTTPTGMSSGTIVIDFNTGGFTSGSVDYTDVDLTYGATGTETSATLAAAAGDNTWGAVVASNNLTLTYPTSNGTAIAASDIVIVKIGLNATGGNAQYTNPTAGNKVIAITAGADSGQLAVAIIADDQVAVTGTVDPSISFRILDNTVGFGHMNSSAVRYATGDLQGDPSAAVAFSIDQIATNGANGLSLTTESDNANSTAGLYSPSTSSTIAADTIANIVLGTNGFAFCATNATSLTLTAGFTCETGSTAIATSPAQFASTTGPVSGGSLDIRLKAGVGGTTKAATDYATTLTIIVTGNF